VVGCWEGKGHYLGRGVSEVREGGDFERGEWSGVGMRDVRAE
jgi:hypothetical protein